MLLPDAEDPGEMQWLRRMVFTSNRNLTQSEAYLIPASAAGTAQVSLCNDIFAFHGYIGMCPSLNMWDPLQRACFTCLYATGASSCRPRDCCMSGPAFRLEECAM